MAKLKRKSEKQTYDNISLTRVTRTIFLFTIIFMLSIIVFDSGNLLTRESVIDRASLIFILIVVNTLAWYAAHEKNINSKLAFTAILTILLIIFAGFMTYWERGMASTSTILYVLPILTIGTLKNRHAIIATSILASATYLFATVKYFNTNFNEGFRIQLWGSNLLYIGTIFTAAWLVMVVADLRHDSE